MKYLFIFIASASLLACNVSDSKVADTTTTETATGATEGKNASIDSTRFTTIQWLDTETQDLGSLQKGQIAEISWKFKNTGTYPLYITNVQAGCGCTTPDVPKEPIAPGEESVIKAKFNSENFTGHVTKEVYVEANNANPNNGSNHKLSFTADIK